MRRVDCPECGRGMVRVISGDAVYWECMVCIDRWLVE